ncbi:hypothetical protein [Nocardioides sp. CFH 31398]|uniref:hypothetical protein n=1 Tax=Nocardioides sp. CFH 31398 TaxID=2919579 RepID=UPI001F06F0E3|nr:hypothetical protein [Nocardioides sp. CFH 31398]MCH1866445.1 hypothetical protein [Nocardioides sp. CFH 31398]
MPWFDESRLDDERALAAADAQLRGLAESGARLRRATLEAAEDADVAAALSRELEPPRAVLVLGPEAELVRTVLARTAGVPVVAWEAGELPGWVGGADLAVVLAPEGAPDAGIVPLVAAAVRRGCQVLAVAPGGSPVADHARGRWSTVLTAGSREPVTVALLALAHLGRTGLGPALDLDALADALDAVAVDCSPYRDSGVNPSKIAAVGLAETVPLVSPRAATPLGLDAADRVGATLRRITGLPVVAGPAADVLPVLEATPTRTVFDDPYDDDGAGGAAVRPSLLLLGPPEDAGARGASGAAGGPDLHEVADGRGVRVVEVGEDPLDDLVAHAATVLRATYAATYLRLGTTD